MEAAPNHILNKEQFPARVVLFDLDGTLIDHFSAIHRSVTYAQKRLGLPESSYEKVRATVGGSLCVTLSALCGDADNVVKAEALFFQHFAEIMCHDVKILPGAVDLLSALKQRGLRLAVLTNKHHDCAKSVLEHLGLSQSLDGIFGTDGPLRYRKPDPRFTMQVLEALDCGSEDCILVGDSPYDFATADAACIPCHLVATGSHSIQELKDQTNSEAIYPDLFAFAKTFFNLNLS